MLARDSVREQRHSAEALDALLKGFEADAQGNQRLKGNAFEALVKQYFLHDSQWRDQFSAVYLWAEWPGSTGMDTGIDLVAIPHNDGNGPTAPAPDAVAIQCKFYAQGHRIQKGDIDSFLAASGKHPFTRRIVVDTTNAEWGKNAAAAIEDQQIPVTRVGLPDLRNSDIDWATYSADDDQGPLTRSRKSPRDHQVRAIQDVFQGFKESDRGTLVMACGTGKTFTALRIAQRCAEDNGGSARILFAVPSLALMSQTLREWSTECELPFHAWSVCSDPKVSRSRAARSRAKQDLGDISVVDLKIPATTDAKKLAVSLARHCGSDGLQVVFTTYQSIQTIHDAQVAGGETWRDFDMVICDEAHRTTGVALVDQDESHFTKIHDDRFIRRARTLYMTATPRLFTPDTKERARQRDVVLTSMDDSSVYGPVFHRLGFGDAVAQGLLTDYKVVVLGVPEDEVSEKYQRMAESGGELNLETTAKLAGCWNALAKRQGPFADEEFSYGQDSSPMRRAVAFCRDIKASKRIGGPEGTVSGEFEDLVATQLADLSNEDDSDNLRVQCRHVDGTMNALVREEAMEWLKEGAGTSAAPVCRILTNARCLSEGVDVPTLDAVLFLSPRKSQVDVIQAVGRVMRRAAGKEFGYIILPVAIPAGIRPEDALKDNKRYQVVWQVLQAIRAHDERFEAQVNAIKLDGEAPENILVEMVSFDKPRKKAPDPLGGDGGPSDADQVTDQTGEDLEDLNDANSSVSASGSTPAGGTGTDANGGSDALVVATQGAFTLVPSQWKDAVFGRLVKKVGDAMYWGDWSKDIADVASRYMALIDQLIEDAHEDQFAEFVDALRSTLNPSITPAQAVEFLAQHLLTKPLLDAMFPDQSFTAHNPVSRAMQQMADALAAHSVFDAEREALDAFYEGQTKRIRQVRTLAGKQHVIHELYEHFFSKAFPKMAERLGIVFTPVEVVDFIIRSADDALRTAFDQSLADPGVSIIEPFAGTGTFVTRLLQLGVIPPDALEHKYSHEIFANEIVLLSYYIAAINIEQVYQQLRTESGHGGDYQEFPGIALTDTFQLHEGDGNLEGELEGLAENRSRALRQKDADITVVVMNPPYSSGQNNANDNNQNVHYPSLDQRIARTYAEQSSGINKNSLYDSYFRALRWASDRIGERGVIAFVSNNSFVDGNSADGVRLSLTEEFSQIFIYDLKGNQRTQGERSRREGGKIFGSGSRTGVAITVLVKDPSHVGTADIWYADVADYAARQDKLNALKDNTSLAPMVEAGMFRRITPNAHGDWLSARDDRFSAFQQIGDKERKGQDDTPALFRQFSGGLKTNRDAWCYNFNPDAVAANMRRMIDTYNSEVAAGHTKENRTNDPAAIKWGGVLDDELKHGRHLSFERERIQGSLYRPFCRQSAYFAPGVNERTYQLPKLFPTPAHPNLAFSVKQPASPKPYGTLMTDTLPDLSLLGASTGVQVFPLFTWERLSPAADPDGQGDLFSQATPASATKAVAGSAVRTGAAGKLDFNRPIVEQIPLLLNGYQRRDNITDATLGDYRDHYGDEEITKEDIFFYVYALLHHPTYRADYEADLKKMLPHIPRVSGFWEYANTGRSLAELHVNYEDAPPYPTIAEEWSALAPDDPWERYKVTKPAWTTRKGARTSFHYNDHLRLTGIPPQAQEYQVSGRSPLDWVIDRYRLTVDKKSRIGNDPNDYCRQVDNPRYIVDLVKSLVTVSMRTRELVRALPPLELPDET